MKCSACSKNECEAKYENRNKCLGEKEGVECTCSCQVSPSDSKKQKTASILAGAAAVAGKEFLLKLLITTILKLNIFQLELA